MYMIGDLTSWLPACRQAGEPDELPDCSIPLYMHSHVKRSPLKASNCHVKCKESILRRN